MNTFSHHQIKQRKDGFEIILYLDHEIEEFSSELGELQARKRQNVEQEAYQYIKEKCSNIKVNVVKIMGGSILISTMVLGVFESNIAKAADNAEDTQQQTYTVKAGDTLWNIASRFNTTVNIIMSTNRLTTDSLQIGQTLIIPGSVDLTNPILAYKVVAGDTLSAIAAKHGVTVDALRRTNHLTTDFLRIGQSLTIPNGASPSSVPVAPVESAKGYQVVAGDTLSGIAARYGVTVHAIKEANQLTTDFLRIGQSLTIPNGTSPSPVAPVESAKGYQVVAGDTLSGIAARYGVTVHAIKEANQLTTDFLRIGQSLTIPHGISSSPSAVTTAPVSPAMTEVNQVELNWLAKMVFCEARGESLQGQIAVAAVILNRVKSNLFPNSVEGVILERSNGHFQFTPAGNGAIHTATPDSTNIEAATRALKGEDPTNGSLYFYNPTRTNDQWIRSRTVSTTIGNHVFAF